MKKIAIMLGIITFTAGTLRGMKPKETPAQEKGYELISAVRCLNLNDVKKLISEKADINAREEGHPSGYTALIWATTLLGAPWYRVYQKPPLTENERKEFHLSIDYIKSKRENDKKEIQNILAIIDQVTQAGANKNLKNYIGKTAYDIAVKYSLPQDILDKLRP